MDRAGKKPLVVQSATLANVFVKRILEFITAILFFVGFSLP